VKLTRFVLARNRLSWLFFALILLLGLTVYDNFPSREEPAIRIPRATVLTWFPGLPPEQVENLITRKLEEKFREIGEIKRVVSYSQPGLSIVEVHVHEHIPDFDPVWQKLRRKAEDVRTTLPEGVQGPFVNDEYADASIVTLALSGEDWSMAELRERARAIRDQLHAVQGVRRVSLYGIQEQRVYLEIDSSVLDADSFSVGEAVRSIRDQNRILPAGEIVTGRRMISVETSGKLESTRDLHDVVVRSRDGEYLLALEDFMEIRADYVSPPTELVYYNGSPAIMISASMQKGGNVKAMGPLLRAFVVDSKKQLPVGMRLEIASMQPDVVDEAISMVSMSLYQTLAVVLVVVMLALGLREGLIVGVTVPLTILAALIIMYFVGVELQFVSLASLIISLGMLVDNAIVIAEDMTLRVNRGDSGHSAAIASCKELALPLLTSTVTTVLAFLPILTVNNTSGEFSRSLAQVVGITLLCSWFMSMTFVPLLASLLLRPKAERRSFFLSAIYRRTLDMVLRRPIVALLVMFALVGGFQGLMKYVPTEMFPDSSRPEVLVYVDLPAGYNVYETENAVQMLNDWLLDKSINPSVEDVAAYIGTGGPRISLSVVPNNPAAHRAFMTVSVTDSKQAKGLLASIRQFAAKEISQASVRTELISRGVVPAGVVELRFSGPDADELYDIARQAEQALASIPDTLHVRNDWENRTRRFRIDIDQARAYRAGVSYQGIADSLNAEFSGTQISVLRQGDTLIPILSRSPRERAVAGDGFQLESIKVLVGDGSSGEYITLDQVANIEEVVQFGNILRRDMAKTVTVSGKHLSWDSARLQGEWDAAIAHIYSELPPGYRIELGGEQENYQQSTGPMLIAVPLFIGLMLCVVVAQFNSVRRTAIVFLTIPMAISGGVLGLFLSDAPLDFIGMLGFLSLAGIVINHAIVLIDKTDSLVGSGSLVEQAVKEAAIHRLRPICITSLTTILGLVPLLLLQDKLFHSMAIIIMSGLAVGTLFTVFAIPVMYKLLLRGAVESAPI